MLCGHPEPDNETEVLRIGGFAAREGGVCVANFANAQHVDLGLRDVRVHIDSPFLTPLVAFRTVWVGTDFTVVDARTLDVLGTVRVGTTRRDSSSGPMRPGSPTAARTPSRGSSP